MRDHEAFQIIAPFSVRPRLDHKPWGGARLSRFGYQTDGDGEPLGEVLVTAGESVITSGPHRGTTLGELTEADPVAVAGPFGLAATGGRPLFPLLIKLIDAGQHLSIQVHPDDAQASESDALGKTEAWHVLEAAPDGTLFLGLDGVAAAAFLADSAAGDGRSAQHLRSYPAMSGESVTIPAGTVHALGAGVVVYEVQQPSEITYRLDDWGRVGADGQPRQRHLDAGERAVRPGLHPEPHAGIALADGSGERRLLAATAYFGLERLALAAGQTIEATAVGSAQVLTAIRGTATVLVPGSGLTPLSIGQGESVVVPAATGTVLVGGSDDAVVLRAWVPDLAAEVIAPARRAGVSDTALAALGVVLP